jgi:wobble nucleotide-excising tRNase
MIQKIVTLKNLGRFINPTFGRDNWNGVFGQTNVVYAQNGSGKTTLSLLFRSLKGQDDLISKKKTLSSKEQPSIILIDEQKKEVKYNKGKWNKHFSNIEIYDSFYIEDNVYIITIGDGLEKPNLFELILGEESVRIRKEIDSLTEQRQRLRKKRANLRYQRKKTENSVEKERLTETIRENLNIVDGLARQIQNLEKN